MDDNNWDETPHTDEISGVRYARRDNDLAQADSGIGLGALLLPVPGKGDSFTVSWTVELADD